MTALDDSISRHPAGKKRDLDSEGPVAGQQPIHCEPCPWKACLICPYKGGDYGPADERPQPRRRRERAEDARHQAGAVDG